MTIFSRRKIVLSFKVNLERSKWLPTLQAHNAIPEYRILYR